MSDIIVKIDNCNDREAVIKSIGKEIQDFDDWFVSNFKGAESLARFEISILKTYLMFKIEGAGKE